MNERKTGVLLHISSLPSPYGIGTFGRSAYEFVDFLVEAGQTYWQVLPLGPTSYGDSPYQSFSTFAGNPYFIDLDFLVIDGFLEEKDLEGINWGTEPMYVDYAHIYENRFDIAERYVFADQQCIDRSSCFKNIVTGGAAQQQRGVEAVQLRITMTGSKGYKFHLFIPYLLRSASSRVKSSKKISPFFNLLPEATIFMKHPSTLGATAETVSLRQK